MNRTRIALTAAFAVGLSALLMGGVAFQSAATLIEEATAAKLVALRESRRESVERLGDTMLENVKLVSKMQMTVDALPAFEQALSAMGPTALDEVRDAFADKNPNPEALRRNLLTSPSGTAYDAVHKRFHRLFRTYAEQLEFHDLFLIDRDGRVIYSVAKEADFGQVLTSDAWKETGLGRVFAKSKAVFIKQQPIFEDFSPYAPSGDLPAGFLISPVMDQEFRLLGFVVLQMGNEVLDHAVATTSGLGDYAETFLVGADNYFRTNSRFKQTKTALVEKAETEAAKGALAGRVNVIRQTDHQGRPTLAAYTPLQFAGKAWGLVAKVDLAETDAAKETLAIRLIIVGAVMTVLATLAAILLTPKAQA